MPDTLGSGRHREILLALIESYIETAEPVGSRTLGRRHAFPLSPATIRKVLADLEEEGYLVQPHASAGRIPTEKAYRLYADALLASQRPLPPPPAPELRSVQQALSGPEGGVEDLLRSASRVLSSLSHYAGVALAPHPLDHTLARADLVRLRPGAVLVVLVSTDGTVQHRLVEGGEDHTQEELEAMARTLNGRYAGVALSEVRRLILGEMREDKARYDRLVAAALRLSARALEPAGEGLMVEGSSNMLSIPDFAADMGAMRELFHTFEEKGRLVALLDRAMKADGLAVVIGAGGELPGMPGVSLVTSTYGAGEAPLGTLGILGPTRMAYSHVIPLVQATARALSERLAAARGRQGGR